MIYIHKKLIFLLILVYIYTRTREMTTLIDDLRKRVIDTRENIKKEAINKLSQFLKTEMIEFANQGLTKGSFCVDYIDEEYNIYDNLKKMLIVEEKNFEDDRDHVFIWLLEEVKKTNVFKDIDMEIKNDCLEFSWCL